MIMFTHLALQTPVRGYQYLLLYIPSDMRDFTMDDYKYMEDVLALQMSAVRKIVERNIAQREAAEIEQRWERRLVALIDRGVSE